MEADAILDFLDGPAKKAAYEHNFAKFQAAPTLDFIALRICIRLLPPQEEQHIRSWSEDSDSDGISSAITTPSGNVEGDDLWAAILHRIRGERTPERLYELAEICLSNGPLAAAQVNSKIYSGLSALLVALTAEPQELSDSLPESAVQARLIDTTIAYLSFLRCSFWLPRHRYHMVDPGSISLLSSFLGIQGLDDIALDALSALLSLLKGRGQVVVAQLKATPPPWTEYAPELDALVLKESVLDESFWTRVDELGSRYTASSLSPKIFRTWFQWISQASVDRKDFQCLRTDRYWNTVRMGLLHGFADQRRYCLGIVNHSLLVATTDIFTPTMEHVIRNTYRSVYEQYATLFETVVLNRYAGQVEASLPELTALLGPQSRVTPAMTVTMLAAALDSTVQESIRKLIGRWYMGHVIKVSDCSVMIQCSLSMQNGVPFVFPT